MYSTCLFCNGPLGTNEAIEAFPVGRRLAFDAAKGRLWVVCHRCERWNLTPLEERWEAIEQCERAFRGTRLRVSTDHIGLARLHEGLDLVRIGSPVLPEMAAWRYGDQFGRRRTRALMISGAAVAAATGIIVASPLLGFSTLGFSIAQLLHSRYSLVRGRRIAAHVPRMGQSALIVSHAQLANASLTWELASQQWYLSVAHQTDLAHEQLRSRTAVHPTSSSTLTGDDAVRAARLLLPAINAGGASKRTVQDAVAYLQSAPTPTLLFAQVAQSLPKLEHRGRYLGARARALGRISPALRLALEMATNEETERRALDGELHLLEGAWSSAEEIAAIADDMFLPASLDETLARLKRDR